MTEKWQDAMLNPLHTEIMREIETSLLPKQLLLEKFQIDLIKAMSRGRKTFMIEMKIDMLQHMIESENNKKLKGGQDD